MITQRFTHQNKTTAYENFSINTLIPTVYILTTQFLHIALGAIPII